MAKRQLNQTSFASDDDQETATHVITNITPKLPSIGMSLAGLPLSSPVPPSRKKRVNATPKSATTKKSSTIDSRMLQKTEKSVFSFSEEVENLCPVCEETCTCGSGSAAALTNQAPDISVTLSCENTLNALFVTNYLSL